MGMLGESAAPPSPVADGKFEVREQCVPQAKVPKAFPFQHTTDHTHLCIYCYPDERCVWSVGDTETKMRSWLLLTAGALKVVTGKPSQNSDRCGCRSMSEVTVMD